MTHYAVIGAGRQGVAAAYDLAKWGDAASMRLADVNGDVAKQAASRINTLIGRDLVTGTQLNVNDFTALMDLLHDVDVVVCAVPFVFIMNCTRAAVASGTNMVDLGGHTDTVLKQSELHETAQVKGITIVPDCGMGPGMNNTLGLYTIEQLTKRGAKAQEVRIWDGGLPQNPSQPWGYQCSFNINGLTNEYDGQAVCLRDGKVTLVDTLTELEIVEFDGVGKLEAFVTSGGTSTVPYTYEGILQVYENKTCRYPGHYAQFKAFKDLGLFREDSIEIVPGMPPVSPRQFYHHLLSPMLEVPRVIDVCVMRARGNGLLDGSTVAFEVNLIDRYDPQTDFTAMERLTGWHAGIMAELIARGEIAPGVWTIEKAISPTRFLEKVCQRGFQLTEKWA